MTATGIPDLERLEQDVYESTWSDGLLDICTGLALLTIGILWVTGLSTYSAFAPAVLIPIWVSARKRIIEPRTGVVQFSAERVGKERTHLFGFFLLGVAFLVCGIAGYFVVVRDGSLDLLQQLNIAAGLPAALLSIPAVLVAISLGLPRFFLYAALLVVAAVPVVLQDLHPGWAFIPCGALSVVVGSVLLAKFLKRHPS